MLKINNNEYIKGENIIAPVTSINTTSTDSAINRETYNRLSPLFKALIVSTTTNGKYNLNITDNKKGFYFNYNESGLQIKVPLSAIFNTNNKITGILGIAFNTAKDCSSHKLGLCQLPDGKYCYARQGESQGSKKSYNYLLGMGSYANGLLCSYYWNLFNKDDETRLAFIRYLAYYQIDTLRFNLKSDLRSVEDIFALNYIANNAKVLLTGYTARDDLYYYLLDLINNNDNIILNGSNIKYTNRFYCTSDILEYLKADNPCRGGCFKNGCMNCYKLRNALITVLIHGAGSDTELKNAANIEFITSWFKSQYNLDISEAFNLKLKGLLSCINKYLITTGKYKNLPLSEAEFKYNNKGDLIKIFPNIMSLINLIKTTGGF